MWKDSSGNFLLDNTFGKEKNLGTNHRDAIKDFDKAVNNIRNDVKPNVKSIKEAMDTIREMETLEEAFNVDDLVRVASDNSHYGDMSVHVIKVDRNGDVIVDLEDYGQVKLPANQLHKNHAIHPMFEGFI